MLQNENFFNKILKNTVIKNIYDDIYIEEK